MKITLDFLDETKCIFVNYIYLDKIGIQMADYGIGSKDLFDGAEILVRPKEEQEGK